MRASDDQTTCTLRVVVSGIENPVGKLRIAVFRAPDGFPEADEKSAHQLRLRLEDVPTSGVTISLGPIKPGPCAVSVHHDLDSDDVIDKHWYGAPKEPYGFSNNVAPKTRAANFKEARFDLKAPVTTVHIRLVKP